MFYVKNNDELIFIVPSDLFKLTCSRKILKEMLSYGTFTRIYHHPNNENLFVNASIDVLIFRYCKNKMLVNTVLYNNDKLYLNNSEGLITFSDENETNLTKFNNIFDI